MADQHYDPISNRFFLDLHGVLKRDAARAIRKRLEECSRYGIAHLEIVYGTPDLFDGSIASVLHGVLMESPLADIAALPREFVKDCAQYAVRIPKVDIPVRFTSSPLPRSEWVFAPFPASREHDIWLRRRCENAFHPFQTTFSREDAARVTGRGCRPQDVPGEALSLAELAAFCGEWEPPAAAADALVAQPIPASQPPAHSPELQAEQEWTALWNEAAAFLADKNWRASEARLQRCMDLAAQIKDGRFLARTLGSLAIVSAAKQNREQSKAYHASANATYEECSERGDEERLEVTSRLVEGLVSEGRLTEAAAMLAEERVRLQQATHPASGAILYVFNVEAAMYLRLGNPDKAAELFERGLQLVENDLATPYAATANLRLQLGLIAAGRGALRPALAYLTQAAEEFDLAPEASPMQRFLCAREVAAVADQLGYGARSQQILTDLVAMDTQPGSVADLARIEALIDLGNLYFRQQLWAEAERRYLQVEQSLGASSPADLRFTIHENLGCIYTHTGRLPEAHAHLARALEVSREAPLQSAFRVAHLRRNMAVAYERTGQMQDARTAYEEVLRTFTDAMAEHPEAAEAHFGLGLLFARENDLDEAEYHLRLALGIKEKVYGQGRPATAINLIKLGHVLAHRGSATQARPMLVNGIRILEENRMDAALLAEAYFSLVGVQERMGQARDAKKSEEKAKFYAQSVRTSMRAVSAMVN